MDIDLEKLRPIIDAAVTNGAAAAAEEFKVPKAYVQSLLSLSRKVGAIPAKKAGATRSYDPAAVVAALASKPIATVSTEFNLSAGTLLKIAADFKKQQKTSPSAGGSIEAVQQQGA